MVGIVFAIQSVLDSVGATCASMGKCFMTDFSEYLQDTFREFGPVTFRRMFGVQGVFFEGLMFGIVDSDALYLKADVVSVDEFTSRGLAQYIYSMTKKPSELPYYLAPDEVMDNPSVMREWAELAYGAALRAK